MKSKLKFNFLLIQTQSSCRKTTKYTRTLVGATKEQKITKKVRTYLICRQTSNIESLKAQETLQHPQRRKLYTKWRTFKTSAKAKSSTSRSWGDVTHAHRLLPHRNQALVDSGPRDCRSPTRATRGKIWISLDLVKLIHTKLSTKTQVSSPRIRSTNLTSTRILDIRWQSQNQKQNKTSLRPKFRKAKANFWARNCRTQRKSRRHPKWCWYSKIEAAMICRIFPPKTKTKINLKTRLNLRLQFQKMIWSMYVSPHVF